MLQLLSFCMIRPQQEGDLSRKRPDLCSPPPQLTAGTFPFKAATAKHNLKFAEETLPMQDQLNAGKDWDYNLGAVKTRKETMEQLIQNDLLEAVQLCMSTTTNNNGCAMKI